MSNIDLSIPGSTNPYYTPGDPGATANAVASGLAMLSSVDFDSLDTDASDGIQRTLQSLRYAAAMLSCDLDSPASQPEDREIEIMVSDEELAQLTAIAEKMGIPVEDAAGKLALEELARRLKHGDPEAAEVDQQLNFVAERMNCTVDEAAQYAVNLATAECHR